MTTLKSVGLFPGTEAEGHLLQQKSPRSAEGHTRAGSCLSRQPALLPATDSYTVISWKQQHLQLPQQPKEKA